jgi:hypothetical protein
MVSKPRTKSDTTAGHYSRLSLRAGLTLEERALGIGEDHVQLDGRDFACSLIPYGFVHALFLDAP